ncbi:hypothetical protein QWY31_14560 [Cytophagales bacterium LB-30]|uniref:MBL fold metallo-hydrolase n=1 Tax=Shiella aurantiaca TaxID=3058365 RepID=A0ABT8F8M3_9BACT|nr:hypothetical protein [Shiella aurantiaca]MDN4166730.1 hypothetical protein [Shiella aurantiaca]
MKNKKHFYTLQILLLFSIPLKAQSQKHSFAYQNFNQAYEILNSSIKQHGILDPMIGIKLEIIGKYYDEGHPYHPDSLVSRNLTATLVYQMGNIEERGIEKRGDRETSYVNKFISNRYFYLDKGKQFYFEISKDKSSNLKEYSKIIPQMILNEAKLNAKSLNYLGQENHYNIISYVDANNEIWQIYIGTEDHLLHKMTNLYFDDRMGDSYEIIEFDNYKLVNNLMLPGKFKKHRLNQIVRDWDVSYFQINDKLDWSLPDSIQIKHATKDYTYKLTSDSIFINPITKNIYEILLPQTNNRLLLALFDKYSVLIEGSYHSIHGDLVIKKIEEKFPKHPVKYFSYSHLHHQYIGFVRSIAANGGTVIAPESHYGLIEKMVNSKHSLNPDRQAEINEKLKYELFDKEYTLKDKHNQLQIYNIGPIHTAQYSVFYFPEAKLLMVGDLLWVYENENINHLSGRTLELFKKLQKLNLDIDQMIISWPVDGYKIKNYVDYKEFQSKGELSEKNK